VQSVLVLGGGSEIALATCRLLAAKRSVRVVLAARKPELLDDAVVDLRAAGAAAVDVVSFDATDFESHEAFVRSTFERFGGFDVVLLAFGVLGDQAAAETSGAAARDIVQTNYTAVVSVAVPLAACLEAQGHGSLVLLSSVAGERVRRSNFVYGSSKAGADGYFQGLADALAGSGVHVMIARPGFVHTKMTAGMKPAPLSVTPEQVAAAIAHGLATGAEIVWIPSALRFVMSALRHTPRALFRRLPL
jgi:decaprenylphospho-beta-D-erythro-pentofuranosid-2-ulose 2-reductase